LFLHTIHTSTNRNLLFYSNHIRRAG
jgi:hypothetical protein